MSALASRAKRSIIARSSARSGAGPRAPLTASPSRLMFFARPSDQRTSRKRRSAGASANARRGNTSTPPASSARARPSVVCGATRGRQSARSTVWSAVMNRLSSLRKQRPSDFGADDTGFLLAQERRGGLPGVACAGTTSSTRQRRCAHQVRVDRVRALPALADGPYHERLAAAHVARREDLVDRRTIAVGVGLDVGARVAVDAELLEQTGVPGAQEAHGQQHEIGLDLELAPRHLAHARRARAVLLPAHARPDQLLDFAVAALEALGGNRPVALAAFLVRRRGAQLDRPVRPHQRLVLLFGRLRQELELRDRCGALAIRG